MTFIHRYVDKKHKKHNIFYLKQIICYTILLKAPLGAILLVVR